MYTHRTVEPYGGPCAHIHMAPSPTHSKNVARISMHQQSIQTVNKPLGVIWGDQSHYFVAGSKWWMAVMLNYCWCRHCVSTCSINSWAVRDRKGRLMSAGPHLNSLSKKLSRITVCCHLSGLPLYVSLGKLLQQRPCLIGTQAYVLRRRQSLGREKTLPVVVAPVCM